MENQEVPSARRLFCFSQEKLEVKQGSRPSSDFSSGDSEGPAVTPFCPRLSQGRFADVLLPLRAEAIPGRCPGSPRIPSAPARLAAVAASSDARPLHQ